VGFLDRLRSKGDKDDAKARAGTATTELSSWLASVMARLQPDKVQFQPGESLGQVFARIFDEEERAVRAGGGDPVVQSLKLESLDKLRQQFPAESAPGETSIQSGEQNMSEATVVRPTEGTYEMVLGGQEELKDVPMAMLLQLISGWEAVVGMVAAERRLPDSLRQEYAGAVVSVARQGKQEELVLVFHAAKEMIQIYRDKLREAGLDQS
jgi:hypothetical protein